MPPFLVRVHDYIQESLASANVSAR